MFAAQRQQEGEQQQDGEQKEGAASNDVPNDVPNDTSNRSNDDCNDTTARHEFSEQRFHREVAEEVEKITSIRPNVETSILGVYNIDLVLPVVLPQEEIIGDYGLPEGAFGM